MGAVQKSQSTSLPPASQDIIRRLVDDRLLVSDAGVVEIAHEALLRTWEPLVGWIEEGKEELLQRLRVKRLAEDLKGEADQPRRQALEQLAALAAAGGSDERAVRKEASNVLTQLLSNQARPLSQRQDAALVLALINAEESLRECLADTTMPVEVRRRAAESLGLLAKRSREPALLMRIAAELEQWLHSDALNLLVQDAHDWAEHDARLPLLQGASRGLQLTASADLPLFGSGPGRQVPMLSLTALEEDGGLRIVTEVVEVPVWMLPLPNEEQIELVLVPSVDAQLGSSTSMHDHEALLSWYYKYREASWEGVNPEELRHAHIKEFALVRQPISQWQWRAVVNAVEQVDLPSNALPSLGGRERAKLDDQPGNARPESLWEQYGQPGDLAVESVSWFESKEWLIRLNQWLKQEWIGIGGKGNPPHLALPGEGQWEAACRGGTSTPFHFGDTLDATWARYDHSVVFGLGRKGTIPKLKQVGINGASGLVNRYGLAEMHGQLYEWCADSWHPNPVGDGWPADGQPWNEEDAELVLSGSVQKSYKLLRGGSWINSPRFARAAFRSSFIPDVIDAGFGLRPCCSSPTESHLAE